MSTRNMKIYISCGERQSPIEKALQVVLDTLIDAEVVESQEAADLIIVDDVRKIVGTYTDKKQYVYFNLCHRPLSVEKPNVVELSISSCVSRLLEICAKIQDQEIAEVVPAAATEMPVLQEKPEARWVLVVDDKPENRAAALQQLGKDFNVVVAEGFDQARQALKGSW